jgi:hypothetical protein
MQVSGEARFAEPPASGAEDRDHEAILLSGLERSDIDIRI